MNTDEHGFSNHELDALRSSHGERSMLGRIDAATKDCEHGFHVAGQQHFWIEPEPGKNAAFEQAIRIGGDFLIFTFAQFPPDDTVFTGDPGEVCADAIATVNGLCEA